MVFLLQLWKNMVIMAPFICYFIVIFLIVEKYHHGQMATGNFINATIRGHILVFFYQSKRPIFFFLS